MEVGELSFFVLSGFLMTSKILLNVKKEFVFKSLKTLFKISILSNLSIVFYNNFLNFLSGLVFKIFHISKDGSEFMKTIFLVQQFFHQILIILILLHGV